MNVFDARFTRFTSYPDIGGNRLGIKFTRSSKPVIDIVVGNITLSLEQIQQDDLLGGVVWNAAIVLMEFLETLNISYPGMNVLELGSGTGAVGLFLACKGCNCVLTDLQIELLERNSKRNGVEVGIRRFDWNEELQVDTKIAWDIIVCSDVLYCLEVHEALAKTLINNNTKEKTMILLAVKVRNPKEEALFFENLTNDFKVYNAVEIDGIIIFGLLNH